MTCRIERLAAGENPVVLPVCGRVEGEHVDTIKELIERENGRAVLDLTEMTLVDRDAVNFLAIWERKGIELRNCPAFLREWIAKEQQRIAEETPNTASGASNDVENSD